MSDRLLDNVARVLASPVPRRQAMKLIAGAAVAFLAGRDSAAADCKKNEIPCGGTCCPAGHVCLRNKTCCPPGQVCGNECCSPGETCISDHGNLRCVPKVPSPA